MTNKERKGDGYRLRKSCCSVFRIIGEIQSPPAALDGSHEERAAKVSSSVISIEQRELSGEEGE